MPFWLKTAPSLFEKAMIRIFQPILHSALVHIDDLLLFSSIIEEHMQLLYQFANIAQKYGVILSEKKMILGQNHINFFGMKISDGFCTPEQHIGESILNFPEESLTKIQIQQFHGIVNYVRDFIPKTSQLINPLTKMLRKNAPP